MFLNKKSYIEKTSLVSLFDKKSSMLSCMNKQYIYYRIEYKYLSLLLIHIQLDKMQNMYFHLENSTLCMNSIEYFES